MPTTRIGKLAGLIAEKVGKVEQYLETSGLPDPSFDVDAPRNLGIAPAAVDIEEARRAALQASVELHDLLTGSSALLRPNFSATSLQFVYRYRIPFKVPLHGTASFTQLAERCGVPEPDVRRLLRFAMVTHRVFCEPREGLVAHTAASRLLVDDEREWAMAGLTWDEDWPASARVIDAVQRWGDSEPFHTGHNLAFDHTDNLYDWLNKNPEESKRFNSAVALFAEPGPMLRNLAAAFPWGDLPRSSTVVDVGGGEGGVSIFLAEKFDQLSFVVQDLPYAVAGQAEKLPQSVKERVRFMEHDFFAEQSTAGDVYILRAVLHNWPDHYCHKILRQLRPALRKGTKIVLQENVIPNYGSFDVLAERSVRAFDMTMMTILNARERDEKDWSKLVKDADDRFELIHVHRPPSGAVSVLVVEWLGEQQTDGVRRE